MNAMSFRRNAALAGLTALALSPLRAQEAPAVATPVTPPVPASAPAAPATPVTPVAPGAASGERPSFGRGPAPAGRRPLSPDDMIGRITLVDEQPTQLVALLEKITGRIALRSDALPAVKINFSSTRDLTRRDAETALESLLALNGIAVMPEGESFLKVVPMVGRGAQPWGEAPPLYLDSVAGLPASDRVVARLFTLKNVPYSTIDGAVQTVVNKARGGSAIALPGANSVLVTDSLANVLHLEEVIARIDTPSKVLFFPLKNTRSDDVVKQLKALQNSGMRIAFAGDVGFEATTVNNQIMVYTNPANETRIAELIRGIDTENAPVTRSEVIPLQHAEASDAVTLIQNVASGTSGTIGTKANSAFTAGQAATRTTQNTTNRAIAPQGQQQGQGARATGPENSTFSSYFTAVADLRSNSLVVYGTDRDIEQARTLIKNVDVQLPQVRIETVIVEVTLADNQASGLDSFGLGLYTGTQGVTGGRHNGDINFNGSQPILPGTSTAPFSFRGSLKDFSLEAIFNKARQDTKIKVLSSPTIVTSHNAKGVIIVSSQQPIVTGTTSTPNSGSLTTSSSVTYQDIGLELDIIPRIGANGIVEMDVFQKLQAVSGSTTIDGNTQPIISNRTANSYVTAENNETIVLAGLQSANDIKTKGKLFLLGDIPWLGDWLFSPETTQSTKTELIVFLKPHVIVPGDRVPAADTPGLREGSLTRESSLNRIKDGVFKEITTPNTIFEKEEAEQKAAEAKAAGKRAEAEAAGNGSGAPAAP